MRKGLVLEKKVADMVILVAFRDQTAGRARNQDKPTDDGLREDRHSNQLKGSNALLV